MGAVAGGSPDDRAYRDYLAGQLWLHAPLEAALGPWVPQAWRSARLVKSRWLRNDLDVLGSEAGAAADAEAGTERGHPVAISSEAQAFGILYVLEGATLGLQVLHKRIGVGSLRRSAASRFMLGYGEATGANWREFVARLETLPSAVWPQVLDAATETFAAFQRRFGAWRGRAVA